MAAMWAIVPTASVGAKGGEGRGGVEKGGKMKGGRKERERRGGTGGKRSLKRRSSAQ